MGHIHHTGIIQLMHYCGPEAFQREPFMEVYRSCRVILVSTFFNAVPILGIMIAQIVFSLLYSGEAMPGRLRYNTNE